MPAARPEDDVPPKQQKAVIKAVDMTDELQEDALKTIYEGLEKFTLEKDVASYIKKEFDRVHGPTWHAVVGRNFGSYVTHETKHFIYCYVKDIAILLFKVRCCPNEDFRRAQSTYSLGSSGCKSSGGQLQTCYNKGWGVTWCRFL